jgi:hypothetical protein
VNEVQPNTYVPVQYRLSDEDRAKFGGPEWVTFDRRKLFELDANELMKIESEMNLTIGQFLAASAQSSALGTKGMLWVARRFTGMKESFEKFNPHIFMCDVKREPAEEEVPEEENPTSLATNSSVADSSE